MCRSIERTADVARVVAFQMHADRVLIKFIILLHNNIKLTFSQHVGVTHHTKMQTHTLTHTFQYSYHAHNIYMYYVRFVFVFGYASTTYLWPEAWLAISAQCCRKLFPPPRPNPSPASP